MMKGPSKMIICQGRNVVDKLTFMVNSILFSYVII